MSRSDWLKAAREHWRYRGQERPAFAVTPGAGQESVWDFPRPPRLAPDAREVVVRWGSLEIARTRQAIRVLETSHPPSFYLPWDDVAREFLRPASGTSFCEWKGPARYWSLVDGDRRLPNVAWSYPEPLAGAEAVANCLLSDASRVSGCECVGHAAAGCILWRLDHTGFGGSVQG
jgi:uncharacterized protein (DUF427 family)